ncbi:MAG: hypothetical protein Q8O22_01835 [Candidatus Omnitrophota bacterium]|nr:hypothetical protein [Candidatus Omnitrophota bacterium]
MQYDYSNCLELNNLFLVWSNLVRLSGRNLRFTRLDKILKLLSYEYLSQDKKIFSLANKFEPSLCCSRNKTSFFRIAWNDIGKKGLNVIRKIFALYEGELSLSAEAIERVLCKFSRLSPYLTFGMDRDAPRLKIYAQLESSKENNTTSGDILECLLELAGLFRINIDKRSVKIISGKNIVLMGVDFYPKKKYAIKVYYDLCRDRWLRELRSFIPDPGFSKELIKGATGCIFAYTFSMRPQDKKDVKKTLYLRFKRYSSDLDLCRIPKFLNYKDSGALKKFIRANTVLSVPKVSFLAFGKDKFTVYAHPGLLPALK